MVQPLLEIVREFLKRFDRVVINAAPRYVPKRIKDLCSEKMPAHARS